MAGHRFLYSNLITSETMLTVSSLRSGIVTSAKKEGTGSAVMTPSGAFSGTVDLEYIVEIDSIAGGAEVGQATFKWSDGSGSWDASGVTTDSTPILLNNGVYVAWATGTGADFVVGDKWYFKGVNLFNSGKMITRDRDDVYRSAALGAPNTITITLGAEAAADALIIFDHNLTSAATITLWGDDAATFDSDGGNAQLIETVTWAADKILHYLTTVDRTKKYWQLRITDAANPDLYIEIGELFLGSYMELSRNYREGFSKGFELLFDSNRTPYGVSKKRFYNRQYTFTFPFGCIVAADLELLGTMIDAIAIRSTGELKPFWFNDDSAILANNWLVDIEMVPADHNTRTFYDTVLILNEVMRSV